ncbi:MAG: hypothetical protein MH321_04875 [Leptospiraceae bacterium]|nr:hypothetical protein [Leptospiraceae bacterium]
MKYIFLFLLFLNFNLTAQSITEISISNSIRELSDETSRYSLEHIIDKTSSPWCISGKDWEKQDSIDLQLDKKANISKIYLANGFFDSKLFSLNSRPSKLILKSDLGEKREIPLKDNFNIETYEFPSMNASSINLSFSNILKGSKFNDICISEVSFLPIVSNDLINNRKSLNERIINNLKKPIVIQSAHSEKDETFTILPSKGEFSLEPKTKNQKSVILYQPYAIFSLEISPSPKITLTKNKNDYDLMKIKIQGRCIVNFDNEIEIKPCKVFIDPLDSSYTVYLNNELTFNSKQPEKFQ